MRQLDAVASRLLVNLTGQVPVLAGADQVAYLDIDDTIKATYGYQKEGAGYGYSKVKGLGALFGIISTPLSAPLIAAARLRKGSTNSAKGAARLVADALATVKRAGVTGGITMRADSAYYNHDVIAAARRCGARFWRHRPHGQGRDQGNQPDPRRRLGGHQVPPARSTTRTSSGGCPTPRSPRSPSRRSRRAARASTSLTRLIVRRVKRLGPKSAPAGQGELFSIWRHHAVFTDSAEPMLAAEATHRDHAIVEQTFSDLKAGPLAHMPSGSFAANSAWTVLAAIAFNLTRATGTLASKFHAKATTATIRAQLITVPARIARSARKIRIHLPQNWPWEHAWQIMFTAATGPPLPTT